MDSFTKANDMNLKSTALEFGYGNSFYPKSPLDLNLEPGLFLGIIGLNGAGKSTLLRTLYNQLVPLGGNIYYGDRLVADLGPQKMARELAIVLPNATTPPFLTLEELLMLGRIPHHSFKLKRTLEDEHIMDGVINQLNLGSYRGRRLGEMSDGERQKAMIGRALMQQTQILVLDEPTTHLDLNNCAQVMSLLVQLSKAGKTILCASHAIELILQSADSIILLDKASGTIEYNSPNTLVENGSIERVFASNLLKFDAAQIRFKLK